MIAEDLQTKDSLDTVQYAYPWIRARVETTVVKQRQDGNIFGQTRLLPNTRVKSRKVLDRGIIASIMSWWSAAARVSWLTLKIIEFQSYDFRSCHTKSHHWLSTIITRDIRILSPTPLRTLISPRFPFPPWTSFTPYVHPKMDTSTTPSAPQRPHFKRPVYIPPVKGNIGKWYISLIPYFIHHRKKKRY